MLGDKPYFFGSNPHTLGITAHVKFGDGEQKLTMFYISDCAAFGHLAQFAYIPMAFPQQIYMKANCDNLLRFLDRMRADLWPDWEEMCTRYVLLINVLWGTKITICVALSGTAWLGTWARTRAASIQSSNRCVCSLPQLYFIFLIRN